MTPRASVSVILNLLTEPGARIADPIERLRLRWIAALLLVAAVVMGASSLLQALTSGAPLGSGAFSRLVAMLACLFVYGLLRTGRLSITRLLLIGAGIQAFMTIFVASDKLSMLYYVGLVMPFACVYYPLRTALLAAGLVSIEIVVLGALVIPAQLGEVVSKPLVFTVLISGAIVITFYEYRRLIGERQAKLVASEAQMRALKEQLEQQARTLDAVLSAAPDLLAIFDREQRVSYVSPSMLAALNAVAADVVGKMWRENAPLAILGDHNPMFIARVIETGDSMSYEALNVPTPAGIRDYEVILTPLKEGESANAVMFSARDITMRKQTEAALRLSEERYRVVTELISDYAFACTISPEGKLGTAWLTDASFFRQTGFTQQEIDQLGEDSLYHPDDAVLVKRDLAAVMRGETVNNDYRIITKSGELRWVRIFRRPLWDEAEQRVTIFYGVAQDIAAQKFSEAQRLRTAVERERLNVINRFVGAFSHFFRNQLAIVESNRYLIERGMEMGKAAEVPRRLGGIHDCVTSMRDQLDNLRVVASLSMTTPIACEVAPIINSVIQEFSPIAQGKTVALSATLPRVLPAVWATPDDLRLAVRHLVANAVHYTDAGGQVAVSVQQAAQQVIIDVSDTGVGIAPDQLDSVFEMFYKGDPAMNITQGGVGLGLSIVRMVAETYGGSIRVRSEMGVGSTFSLYLITAEFQPQ